MGTPTRLFRMSDDIGAAHLDGSRGRQHQGGCDVHQGGLARTVGAQQRNDPVLGNLEAETLQYFFAFASATEVLVDVIHTEYRLWCSIHQFSFPSLGFLVDLEAVGQVLGRKLCRVQETTRFESLRVCAGFAIEDRKSVV